MSDDVRTERLVTEWLDEMRHPRPQDHVVDAVLSSLPSTRQESTVPWRVAIRRFGRVGLAAAAGIAVGAVAVFVLVRPEPLVQPGASPSPSATPSPSLRGAATSLPPGVAAIDMGAETWTLTVDDASVWVRDWENVIRRIDRATNVAGERAPWAFTQMQLQDGQLWGLRDGGGILRIDPITGTNSQEIAGVSGVNLVVDGSTAWVSDAGHTVDRVDLETGQVVASIDVPPGPGEMIVFEGDVWVVCDEGGVVARIDGETNTVVATIDAGWRPVNLAGGEGAVWVRNQDPSLLRIDPATNTVAATIDGVAQAHGTGVAVGGGAVWVVVSNGIGRVDPATNEIVEVIPIGRGAYVDLVWFDGELWASSTDRNTVYRMKRTQ